MIAALHQPIEHVELRALGAFRFVDATTGQPVRRLLDVESGGLTLRRNRRGFYVIARAPGLEELSDSFEEQPVFPDAPVESLSFDLRVEDRKGLWLPRGWSLRLPRDPSPANADEASSLFRALDVPLLPSPSATVAPAWALIRANLRREGAPLGGALIEVEVPESEPDAGPMVFRGMTDWRGQSSGEGLVTIPGIRFLSSGNGDAEQPVFSRTVTASVRIVFDPDFAPELGQLPDPDRLLADADQLETTTFADQELASGRTLVLERTLIPTP